MSELLGIIPESLWVMWGYMTFVCIGPVFMAYAIQRKIDKRSKRK